MYRESSFQLHHRTLSSSSSKINCSIELIRQFEKVIIESTINTILRASNDNWSNLVASNQSVLLISSVTRRIDLGEKMFSHSRLVSGHWHEQQSDLEETSFFSLVCHGATPSGTPHTHIDPSLLCKEHFLVDESPRFPPAYISSIVRLLSVDRSFDFREIYPTAF